VPEETANGCEIIAENGAVNKRSGVGTGFEIIGVLEANGRTSAIMQASGQDNLTWWQLEDRSWVRAVVVREQGTCSLLPNRN
jgi:hypothetical protein